MDTQTTYILVAAVALAAVAVGVALYLRQKNTTRLRARFGPEYDRAVEANGDRARAEAGLKGLEKRVATSDIHPLSPADRERYVVSWRMIQERFVEDPKVAVGESDKLLGDVMSTRGYSLGDFEQRSADISVDHPMVVENYRVAHRIATRPDTETSTEDLRQAMILFRSLFDELVGGPGATPAAVAA